MHDNSIIRIIIINIFLMTFNNFSEIGFAKKIICFF